MTWRICPFLFAALVILLVQSGALVHATEHPFHQDDVLCASLQSAEQEKHFFLQTWQ